MDSTTKKGLLNNKWFQLVLVLLIVFSVSFYAWNKNLADLALADAMAQSENENLMDTTLTEQLTVLLGTDKLKDVAIDASTVTISFDPGKVWNEEALVKAVARASVSAFEVCYQDELIQTVHFLATPRNKQDIQINLAREQAQTVDWERWNQEVHADYTQAYTQASSYSLPSELASYIP